jgi:hypothetical protein
MENVMMNIIPTQKNGRDQKISEKIEKKLSNFEYGFLAQRTPSNRPKVTEIAKPTPVKIRVFGRRSRTRSKTGFP